MSSFKQHTKSRLFDKLVSHCLKLPLEPHRIPGRFLSWHVIHSSKSNTVLAHKPFPSPFQTPTKIVGPKRKKNFVSYFLVITKLHCRNFARILVAGCNRHYTLSSHLQKFSFLYAFKSPKFQKLMMPRNTRSSLRLQEIVCLKIKKKKNKERGNNMFWILCHNPGK